MKTEVHAPVALIKYLFEDRGLRAHAFAQQTLFHARCRAACVSCVKTDFIDRLRGFPAWGSLLLLSFWNISERKLDALLDLYFAALNICAILREYRRLHAPRDAAAC